MMAQYGCRQHTCPITVVSCLALTMKLQLHPTHAVPPCMQKASRSGCCPPCEVHIIGSHGCIPETPNHSKPAASSYTCDAIPPACSTDCLYTMGIWKTNTMRPLRNTINAPGCWVCTQHPPHIPGRVHSTYHWLPHGVLAFKGAYECMVCCPIPIYVRSTFWHCLLAELQRRYSP